MDALSREIGSRGRADAVVADADATDSVPEPHAPGDDALNNELNGMRLAALHKRALAEGIAPDALEDAMDADDPKTAMIAAIVDAASRRGPADRLLSALEAGGEASADALSAVLDHAMDVLEQLSFSSPRKSRKGVRAVAESVEELSEMMDGAWCDGVSRCGCARLEGLSSAVSAVQALEPSTAAAMNCADCVSSMLALLRECGSVAVQCSSVLSMPDADEESRLGALECVRGLSCLRLDSVSGAEASLFSVLLDRLSASLRCTELEQCWLALFVLGCRNGVSLVATEQALKAMMAAGQASLASLGAASMSGDMDGALRVNCAASQCGWGTVIEAISKTVPEGRTALNAFWMKLMKGYVASMSGSLGFEACSRVFARIADLRLLEDSDVDVACGASYMFPITGLAWSKAIVECDRTAIFGGGGEFGIGMALAAEAWPARHRARVSS
eukprot:SAG22_NODE_4224_length_1337_cov_1.051696_1_plen_445_part_11